MPVRVEIKATKATYPQRSCRDHVWGEFQAHLCELPELHEGPCVSWSVRESLQRRRQWETDQEPTAGEDKTA
jgi:hypothetical protein